MIARVTIGVARRKPSGSGCGQLFFALGDECVEAVRASGLATCLRAA